MNETTFFPRTWAEISKENLLSNYRIIKNDAKGAKVCCVVKADAYGHGARYVVKALQEAGADYFAASSIEEAEDIRLILGENKTPILILGYTRPEYAKHLIRDNISQAITSPEYAEMLLKHIPDGARLSVHPAIDTGMNRIGYLPSQIEDLKKLFAEPSFSVDGIFTHFFLADEPSLPATSCQYGIMKDLLNALKNSGISLPPVHVCNSAALNAFPEYHCDMVRAGISLYGLKPSDETPITGLKPVMTVKTILSHIHTAKKGETVGYGASYTLTDDTRIGTLPIGYADGYIRGFAKGEVLINGKRAKLLGRICMDQCMVDLTHIPEAKIGDEVTLFGDGEITAEHLAALSGTIHYEVVCLVSKRVPRIEI